MLHLPVPVSPLLYRKASARGTAGCVTAAAGAFWREGEGARVGEQF